ncbi:MAG TPA: 2-C-methyl-D-erythritol 2,4-cyclodiphosphate synthase [Blastocatellia bacterium]|nr:2-C-methyl-D-erythritol 2,4-cyclodiphosphate synthase [Blastocatellia bacterium]
MDESIRIGIGYDTHRLVEGRKLVLAGVEVPFEKGLLGHSDSDVLAHAITDALLGAAALGDIGSHFPDTDGRWEGASSLDLLARAVEMIAARGYRVGNVDAIVMAERPRLSPHIQAMRERLAATLGVDLDRVSIKAKTGEGLGAIGRGEAMAAHAVALILR